MIFDNLWFIVNIYAYGWDKAKIVRRGVLEIALNWIKLLGEKRMKFFEIFYQGLEKEFNHFFVFQWSILNETFLQTNV